jgi:hypothetical protein
MAGAFGKSASSPSPAIAIILLKVSFSVAVSPLTNGVSKEGDDLNSTEYYIKCPQCQKGCQTFQALKEHMEAAHADLATAPESGPLPTSTPSAVSPTPSLVGAGGPFGCSQCTTSFATKDQLEKHELLHSPNAQVVSEKFRYAVVTLINVRLRCVPSNLVTTYVANSPNYP